MEDSKDSAEAESQEKKKFDLQLAKSKAVSAAMIEVVGENRQEIIRRARAKLVAAGVPVEAEELGEIV